MPVGAALLVERKTDILEVINRIRFQLDIFKGFAIVKF